jgi:serine protease AprX
VNARVRRLPVSLSAIVLFLEVLAFRPSAQTPGKLDPFLQQYSQLPTGRSRVVVVARDAASVAAMRVTIQQVGGTIGLSLPIINGVAATVPNTALAVVAASNTVNHAAFDRLVGGTMERTGATTGAASVRQEFGLDGSGIGVAVIDSGIAPMLDDLSSAAPATQRVDRFVDFVSGRTTPYDDYGHGTHVAGIIAGNGADSAGARSGIAPAARIVALKVLDAAGHGRISDVIAALDYAVAHRSELNIRVINLSVATGVYESYTRDPLTIAAQRAVDSGIVVVASAGNAGRNQQGQTQYGGITAPGNAPSVLTVGASSHMGTVDRSDDVIAPFSSRGPTAVDRLPKPDLVAPGVGIESLSSAGSTLYNRYSSYLLAGTTSTSYLPYLSLSGTSQSAPVVAGTVALMLQANAALTPNQVKAILQFTAEASANDDVLTQGAGYLNAGGAVRLSAFLADPSGTYPDSSTWSGRLIWGSHLVSGGVLTASSNAWSPQVVWGAAVFRPGQPIIWGAACAAGCDGPAPQWGPWGLNCGDPNCRSTADQSQSPIPGSAPGPSDGTASGASTSDTVVWGTNSNGSDTVVWGTSDGDTVVWGTSCDDPSCDPVVWPHH